MSLTGHQGRRIDWWASWFMTVNKAHEEHTRANIGAKRRVRVHTYVCPCAPCALLPSRQGWLNLPDHHYRIVLSWGLCTRIVNAATRMDCFIALKPSFHAY